MAFLSVEHEFARQISYGEIIDKANFHCYHNYKLYLKKNIETER